MPRQEKRGLSFIEWFGFREDMKLSEAPLIGYWLGFLISTIIIVFIFSFFVILVKFTLALFPVAGNTNVDGSLVRNLFITIAAFLGAPVIVWRTMVAAKQANTAQDSLQNDKINDAMNQLNARYEVTERIGKGHNTKIIKEWKDDITTRVAAIAQLEVLVNENYNLAPKVVDMLATYIRVIFSINRQKFHDDDNLPPPRPDLQASISTIGRILKIARKVDSSMWRLDLSNCNFSHVDFSDGWFFAINFSKSKFENANFIRANLNGATFFNAVFDETNFERADLKGTKFDYSKFISDTCAPHTYSSFSNAALFGTSFLGTKFNDINLQDIQQLLVNTIGYIAFTDDERINLLDNQYYDLTKYEPHDGNKLDRFLNGSIIAREFIKHWFFVQDMELVSYPPPPNYTNEFYTDRDMNHWPYGDFTNPPPS